MASYYWKSTCQIFWFIFWINRTVYNIKISNYEEGLRLLTGYPSDSFSWKKIYNYDNNDKPIDELYRKIDDCLNNSHLLGCQIKPNGINNIIYSKWSTSSW